MTEVVRDVRPPAPLPREERGEQSPPPREGGPGRGRLFALWRRWFALPLPTRTAVGVCLAVFVAVFVRVLVQGPNSQTVVPIYLGAGERWLAGVTLYHLHTGHDLYRNPPAVAALFAPFALLDPKTAAVVWRLVCWAAYLAGVRSLVRDVLPPLSGWQRAAVWMLSVALAVPAINNGQANLMIVAAALLGAGAAARGRWWVAAGWLAFAGWLKVYPFAVGLLCVLAAPRQLGWRLAVTAAVLFAAPFGLQDPRYVWGEHQVFVDEMGRDDRTAAHVGWTRVPRDWTVLPRLAADVCVPRAAAVAVGLVAAAGMAVLSAGSTSPHGKPGFYLPLCLGLIWVTLFGPGTEMNTYSVLAPVAGAVAVTATGWRRVPAWAAAGLLLATIVRASLPPDAPVQLIEAQPVAAALLLVAVFPSRGHSVSHPR